MKLCNIPNIVVNSTMVIDTTYVARKIKSEPFYFLLHIYDRESIVFGLNFRNGGFSGFTRFEVP